jgi:anti-sigma regulatory factor (Ser/Thr protein kinase)
VPAVPGELAGIRAAVSAFAERHGAPVSLRHDMALAVSEACSNAVVHAYVDAEGPGQLVVEAFRRDGELTVVVGDDGRGMISRLDSPGLGVGLAVIGKLAAKLEIGNGSTGRGTTLRMTFVLGHGHA